MELGAIFINENKTMTNGNDSAARSKTSCTTYALCNKKHDVHNSNKNDLI